MGSGGREHCFAELISKSKHCDKLFVAPGNSGTSLIAQNLDISPVDFDLVKGLSDENNGFAERIYESGNSFEQLEDFY